MCDFLLVCIPILCLLCVVVFFAIGSHPSWPGAPPWLLRSQVATITPATKLPGPQGVSNLPGSDSHGLPAAYGLIAWSPGSVNLCTGVSLQRCPANEPALSLVFKQWWGHSGIHFLPGFQSWPWEAEASRSLEFEASLVSIVVDQPKVYSETFFLFNSFKLQILVYYIILKTWYGT